MAKTTATPGYSGKPLAAKLGLAAGQRVVTRHAPDELADWLGSLPERVTLCDRPGKNTDLAVVFVTKKAVLAKEFGKLAGYAAPKGMIWVCWPKKSANVPSDLDENIVREVGLAEGWVDVKVCAVSEVWSGLKFLRRKAK